MKKQSIYLIGLLMVAITGLNGYALSTIKEEQGSNYVLTWNMTWKSRQKTTPVNEVREMQKPGEPEISICTTRN
jgi:hypothetical protein